MSKFTRLLALVALMAVPFVANAQNGCTIHVDGTDQYGDGWNGGALTIAQGGTTLETFTLSSGASGSVNVVLPTSDPVTFTWSSGSWDSEVSFSIYDGGNTLVYSVSNPSAGVVYTMSSPCPSCLPPTNLVATGISTDGMTVSWSDPTNTGDYTLSYWAATGDTTTINLTDTSYTLTNLDALTLYFFSVVTNCSSTDTSSALNGSFSTACNGSTCDVTLELGTSSTYSNPFTYYSGPASVELFQAGTSLGAYSSSTTVEVCSTTPVVVKYNHSGYTYSDYYDNNATITVRDGGGTSVYSGSWGDTLCVINAPCPTCIPPTALNAQADSNSIAFSWTPRSGASQFIVYLGDSLVNGNVTDTFYTFTGLNSNTQYTVKVQSICSSDDSSSIVSYSIRTECGSMSVPFFEDFASYGYGTFPECWHRVRQHGSDPSVNTEISGLNGSMYMFLMASNDTNLFVTPSTVPLAGDMIHVSYDAYLGGSGSWIKAGVMTNYNDVSTFIALDSVGYHDFGGQFESRDFNTSTLSSNASYYIAWMYFNTTTSNRGAVDNISISEDTGCDRPNSASAPANITAHTADLTWSSVTGVSSYTVYYGTVNNPASSSLLSTTVSDTTVTLTGLSSETQYYAWVVSNCGSTESEVRPFASFTTLISCPRVTGLTVDTTTSDGASIHWIPGGTETEWYLVIDNNEIGVVTDTFYTFTSLDAMTGHTVYVRPICGVDDTGATRSVNFATRCGDAVCNFTAYVTDSYNDSWNGGYITIMQAGVAVATIDCPSGQSGTTYTYEVCSSDTVTLILSAKGSYPNEMGGYIQDGGGNTVFTISSMGSHSNGEVLATVATPCPECIAPMNLSVVSNSITADGATISWNGGDASSWIIHIDSLYYNVNDTFYTFSGLNARTTYTAYVATDCSGDTSVFNSVAFTTDCATGSCDITVDMGDSFGDGWNGGHLNFYQYGALAGTANLSSGNSGTATVNVCSGTPVTFNWSAGSYDSEVSYIIYDGGDAEIYNSATGGVNHSDSIENACPSCITPDSLVVTLIDSNDLEFAWRVIDSVYGYIVSFNGGAWTPAIGSYNASSLTPNTTYTFSVKAVCQVGDTSNARTITAKTACGQMVVPFTESFENDNTGIVPSCWTVTRPGYSTYPSVSGSAHTGNHALTLGANYNDTTTIATSLVPLAGNEIHVGFWASVNSGNTLYAGVMTDLAYDSTFIPLLTVPYNNSTYTHYEFNTSDLPFYEEYYVAFRLVSGGNNHFADIDDINIQLYQGCMSPTNLTATPAAHSVTLGWSNSAPTANFAVQYRLTSSTTWDTTLYTNDTNYTVTGLLAATEYTFRVGFICTTDTLWTSVNTQTTCDLLQLPYFEDFDSYANDVMPPCWEWSTTFCTHWDGGVFFRTYHGGGSEYVVVPQLDGNITKLQIEFDCKVGTIAEQDGILFGVTDATGTLITWLDTIQDVNHSRNAHVHHILNMLNYTVPGGAARIAFAQLRNWGEWALIDNINITELPDCYPVDSLAATNLIDPDHTTFTWASLGEEAAWQVYVDTVTANIDSIPDSLFVDVYTRSYEIPMGTIQGGGIYTFYVRSNCGAEQSNWNSYTFGAGTYVMNNSSTADTVVACGLVVYDNGGPIAGYLPNSNSALVIRSENAGSELQVFGAAFGIGSSGATLNVYDGEGTSGTLLYTYNTTDGRDTILNTNLATSTTGALTITFVANGSMCHTGYELYIHCVGAALCERPTQLNAVMTEVGEAMVTWHGNSAAYDLYYKPTGATNWTIQSTLADSLQLTGLLPDTTYDMQVVGICGTDTSTPSFPIVLNTHYNVVITPCDPITGLTVGNLTNTTAVLSWTSNASNWEIEVVRVGLTDTIAVNTNPYTLTGLLPNMQYTVRVRTACSGVHVDPYSDWSATETFTTPLEGPQTYTLTVLSNNDAWGTVTGGGSYIDGTVVTITATANEGYYFDRWNDGDTNATRTVTVTANATYTANFAANGTQNTYFTVTVSSNNPDWGTVSGGGEYIENSTARITATANSGYHFVEWNDGNTDNPRTFTVIASVSYIATFAPNTGIDDVNADAMTIFPNPANTTVTVRLQGFEGDVMVEVVDLNGKRVAEVRTQNSELTIDVSSMAQGAYFVRVTGEKATAVSRLIVR